MMISNKRIYFLFLSFLGFVCSLNAQVNDFETWNSINLSIKPIKKTTFYLSQELRMFENSTQFKKYLVDVGGEVKVYKKFKLTLGYRYSRFNDLPEAYKNEHLFSGSLGYSLGFDRFNLSVQTKFQHSYEVNGWKTIRSTETTFRNKLSLAYDIYRSPLSPYAYYELFTLLNEPDGTYNEKYRLLGGVKYKLQGSQSIAAFFGIQKSLLKAENTYITGLKYSITFDFKGKKDNDNDDNSGGD